MVIKTTAKFFLHFTHNFGCINANGITKLADVAKKDWKDFKADASRGKTDFVNSIQEHQEDIEDYVVQHITVENFKHQSSAAVYNILKELVIKKDIATGKITLVDWSQYGYKADWLFGVVAGGTYTDIPANAFLSCAKLADVTIADTVTSIGEYAFSKCENVTEINLPEGIEVIEESIRTDAAGKLVSAYIKQEIGGFAVHIVRK